MQSIVVFPFQEADHTYTEVLTVTQISTILPIFIIFAITILILSALENK